MKITEILNLIKRLAQSQGMYGRLYRQLMDIEANDIDNWKQVVQLLEEKNFQDDLDFILWYEC